MNRIRRYRDTGVNEVAPKDDHRIDAIMKELEYLRSELAQKRLKHPFQNTLMKRYLQKIEKIYSRMDLLVRETTSKSH